MTKLKILNSGKSEYFNTPLDESNKLVRTGTIADGSCFFHALLSALSTTYLNYSEPEQQQYVKRMRAKLSKKLNKTKWEQTSNGMVSKILFQEEVNNIFTSVYGFINSRPITHKIDEIINDLIDNDNKLQIYKVLTELLPLDTVFEQNILPKAYNCAESISAQKCKDKIIEEFDTYFNNLELIKKLSDKKISHIHNNMKKLILSILDNAEDTAFNSYKNKLKDSEEFIDTFFIDIISDFLNVDIYFFDSETKMPYKMGGDSHIKGRKSVFVLWVDKVHYEILGRVILNGENIIRIFSVNDEFVKKVHNYLYNEKNHANDSEMSESYSGSFGRSPVINKSIDSSTNKSPNKSPNKSNSDGKPNRFFF